jgi:hypothetical protein
MVTYRDCSLRLHWRNLGSGGSSEFDLSWSEGGFKEYYNSDIGILGVYRGSSGNRGRGLNRKRCPGSTCPKFKAEWH